MLRTVPNAGNEEIELYIRTYYSLLRSSDAIKIQSLVESHAATDSSLHVKPYDHDEIDLSAFVYAALRLPPVMHQVRLLILGQLTEDFKRIKLNNVENWTRVHAVGRRRRTHFNDVDTLAVMIASRSDIDDLIPMLVSFQIEWNKMHRRLYGNMEMDALLQQNFLGMQDMGLIAQALDMPADNLARLQTALKENFNVYLREMVHRKMDLSLQLLAGSQVNYRKAASRWWENLDDAALTQGTNLRERPVYFVSSNTHVLGNLISGYAQEREKDLQSYMGRMTQVSLLSEWDTVQQDSDPRLRANFLYYLLKKYQANRPESLAEMAAAEKAAGLTRVEAEHGFDVEGQILQLNQLQVDRLDPRLSEGINLENLGNSDALVINIDYPLGLAAFELLTRVGEGCSQILGVYIMGKAATLNGRIGDVMLPNVVYDEHSKNSYLFNNCFKAMQLMPYLAYGTLLDNQKAVTVRGTFLQNRNFMDVFYKEGYTIIEMEGGPYLSAVYEMMRPIRHPSNEIINLYSAPFDVGFIHYASDTPFSKGHNLGAGNLGYQGMDATYASAVAIMRRVLMQESARLARQEQVAVK